MVETREKTPEIMEAEAPVGAPGEDDEILMCQWHPKVETTLRCYLCNTPMCVKCARRTPVGYICRDCKAGRKRRFEQIRSLDYAVALISSTVLGAIASSLALLGAWWYLIFLSPLAGAAIAEVVWRLVGRRYGQHLWWVVGAGIVLGSLPVLLVNSLGLLSLLHGDWWGITGILSWGLHIVITVGAAIARFRLN